MGKPNKSVAREYGENKRLNRDERRDIKKKLNESNAEELDDLSYHEKFYQNGRKWSE